MFKNLFILTVLVLSTCFISAQELPGSCLIQNYPSPPQPPGPDQTIEAKNGWYLPTSGEIRVLVIYIEMDYDVTPSNDPIPAGTPVWSVGQLPNYKDDLFDVYWTGTPQRKMTKYYDECSFGALQITGDYVNSIITVKESDIGTVTTNNVVGNAFNQINALGSLNTSAGLTVSDFDKWQNKNSIGQPQIAGPDSPFSFDHIMIIYRNLHVLTTGSGFMSAWPHPSLSLLGFSHDTHTQFRGGSYNPFSILRHEFNHCFFGSNFFHTGGSHSVGGGKFIPDQGGWSMMGGSGSSLQTCNGWDRDRFDWRGPGKSLNISTVDASNNEINADLDATNMSQEGIYILRDFVTTGDALRIKLPFIPNTENQQYIWVENHQTVNNNGSEFDRFQYDDGNHPCMESATPGLYLYMQAGKTIKTGSQTYGAGERGHYLRPIPANGMYDIHFEPNTILHNGCITTGFIRPFEKLSNAENPLTGSQDMEVPAVDVEWLNNGNPVPIDDQIWRKDQLSLWSEKINGVYYHDFVQLGQASHAFTLNGVNKIGMGTNPSANSMLTLESENNTLHNGDPDNRAIILNGISIEILDELPNGSIRIEVKFSDVDITNDASWAGPDIQLPPLSNINGHSLNLKSGNTISLVQGYTATRIRNPITINGQKYFVDNTDFSCQTGSHFNMENNSSLVIAENSRMTLKSGSTLELQEGALLHIYEGELTIEDGAELILHNGAKILIDTDGKLTNNNTVVGKGLIVGDQTIATGDQAEVTIYGTLSFDPSAIWEHKNAGFYHFIGGHQLQLPSSVPVQFDGLGNTIKFLQVNGGKLTFSGNDVDFSNGYIYHNLSSSIVMNNQTDITISNVNFESQLTSGPSSFGVEIDDPLKVLINNCSFDKYKNGIKATNTTPTLLLLSNVYTNCFTSIDLNAVKQASIAGSSFSNGVKEAIRCANGGILRVTNSDITTTPVGAEIFNTEGSYFEGDDITYATIGINANNTLLFLRNGTEIHQSDIGVQIFGYYNQIGSNYTAMLTAGDLGCASIYDNSDKGVYGIDVILNIDAEQHAIDRGDPNSVVPNRFDNNVNYAFDVCYSTYSAAPSQVNANGNYWGTPTGNISSSNYRLKTNTDCIAKPSLGVDIPLITNSYSTCTPTPSCMDCITSPGSGFPGGGGGLSNAAINVRNAFENANAPFQVEDKVLTRLGFADISAVELVKDTTDSSWVGISIDNEVVPLEETESVHRIQVSKAIKEMMNNGANRVSYTPSNIFAGLTDESELELNMVKVYPNPAKKALQISAEDDSKYTYSIQNVIGQTVQSGKFNKNTIINTEDLNGIYFVEIIDEAMNRKVEKVIFEN